MELRYAEVHSILRVCTTYQSDHCYIPTPSDVGLSTIEVWDVNVPVNGDAIQNL